MFGKKVIFNGKTICENNSNIDFSFLKLDSSKYNLIAIEANEILDVCRNYRPYVGQEVFIVGWGLINSRYIEEPLITSGLITKLVYHAETGEYSYSKLYNYI